MKNTLIMSLALAFCFISVAGAIDNQNNAQIPSFQSAGAIENHGAPPSENYHTGWPPEEANSHNTIVVNHDLRNSSQIDQSNNSLTAKPISNIAEDQITARGLRVSDFQNQTNRPAIIDPPPNDNCQDVVPEDLFAGTPLIFSGNNVDATQQCPSPLGSFPEVWHGINTYECMDISISYCGTDPVFNDVYIILNTGCPCDSRIRADYWTPEECEDWNYTVHFYNVPAGTYYIPILSAEENGAWGPYTITVSGEPCTPPENDNCVDVTPVPISASETITFTGNNANASNDCSLLTDPQVWHAVTTSECVDLTVDYCTTDPVFGNVYILLMTGCPCEEYILTNDYTPEQCGDGNYKLRFYNLPAGTYYIPILTDYWSQAAGPYNLNVTATACPTPPANDNCSDVAPVTLEAGTPAVFMGNTYGATVDCQNNNDPYWPYPEVWHAVTINECMNIKLDYCGTDPSFGNIFSVIFENCACSELVRTVYFSGMECSDGNYAVFFNRLQPGTYYIPVLRDASMNSSGPYTLTVTGTACPTPLVNDNCADIIPDDLFIFDTLTYVRTNEWATADCPVQYSMAQVWEAFTTYEQMDVTISFCGTDPVFGWYNPVLATTCPCQDPLTYCSAANTNACLDGNYTVYFTSLPPGTYFASVPSSPYNQGIYTMKIWGSVEVPPSTNDDCADAIEIGIVTNLPFNTTEATADGPQDCVEGPNIWYKFIAPSTGLATISLCNSLFDTYMAIYDGGNCNPLGPQIDCNDNYCGVYSKIQFLCTEGNEYLVDIGGYVGETGTGSITTTVGPIPRPTPTCDENSLFGQSPYGFLEDWNRDVSDANHMLGRILYDNFSGVTGDICGVKFWGMDLFQGSMIEECTEIDMQFQIIFYNDNGGMPGDTVSMYSVTPSRTSTGIWYHDEFELNEYVVDLGTCCTISNGWISIQGISLNEEHDCWFFWFGTPYGDHVSFMREAGNTWYQVPFDWSFCLLGPAGSCEYVPGDINGNGSANGIDVTYGVTYLKGGSAPPDICADCPNAGQNLFGAMDVNGSCSANGIDITFFVAYLKQLQPALLFCQSCPPVTAVTANPVERPTKIRSGDIKKVSEPQGN